MKSVDSLMSLEEIGSMQWGLVTTAQATRVGVGRVTLGRLVDRGALVRVRHGVYALPSSRNDSLQDLQAAWMAIDSQHLVEERLGVDEDAVVSHFSAAVVHGLGDVLAPKHEFTSSARRQTSQFDVRFYKAAVEGNERTLVNGLPVTSVARTVADLASSHLDFDHLALVIRDALSHVSPDDLAQSLASAALKYGVSSGEELVDVCLDKAGLPETVTDVVSNYEHVFASLLSPQVEKRLEPLLRTLAANYTLPINKQLREIMKRSLPAVSMPTVQLPESATLGGKNAAINAALRAAKASRRGGGSDRRVPQSEGEEGGSNVESK